MLTRLTTLKTHLAILESDTTNDAILTAAIKAVSGRFDKESNRTLAGTENTFQEFDPEDLANLVPCYPIKAVTRFELKTTEAEGWIEEADGLGYKRSALL